MRNKKEFAEVYGNYMEDKFENIMDEIKPEEKLEVGRCEDYPKASFKKANYFDAVKFFSEGYVKNKQENNFIDFVNKEIKRIDDFDVK